MARGLISRDSVRGDFYQLLREQVPGRRAEEEITIFKNGGGAHLDPMIAHYLSELVGSANDSGTPPL